jgi:uncharacterized protein (TIGR00255 family)
MPIYSMTGYASAQTELHSDSVNSPALRLGLEIRSVNSRFLDLTFKMPEELRQHEAALRELVTQHLKRGKVEVRANIESTADTSFAEPSSALLQRLSILQEVVHAHLPKANGLSVADVLRLATAQSAAPADIGPAVLKLAKSTLTQLSEAREREGARLGQTLRERLAPRRPKGLQHHLEAERPGVEELRQKSKPLKDASRW